MVEQTSSSADAEAVSQAAAAAVAAVAQAVLAEQQQELMVLTVLPHGWVRKTAQSQPNCFYYYNYETGVSTWQTPGVAAAEDAAAEFSDDSEEENQQRISSDAQPTIPTLTADQEDETASSKKRSTQEIASSVAAPAAKHIKPKQVRALHILKKHKDSRKPTSWRVSTITQSVEDSRAQLEELMTLLDEVKHDPEELRATFEELARTESDCSSAKRGGDLGFFGPKKMQPAFEAASFVLEIGELSSLVETNSGVHIILRIG